MHKTEILALILQDFFVRKADEDTDVTIKSITATKAGYTIVTQYNIHKIEVPRSTTDKVYIKWNDTIYQFIDDTWVPLCTL